MDVFGLYRSQLMSMLDECLSSASKLQKERSKGQLSFFDSGTSENGFLRHSPVPPQIREWPEIQILAFEQDVQDIVYVHIPWLKYGISPIQILEIIVIRKNI